MEGYYLQCGEEGGEKRRVIPLRGDEVIVGRKELLLSHISRRHAVFKRNREGWTVTSMGQNSMVVNGNMLVRGVEYPLALDSEVKFTERDTDIYRFKVAHGKGGKLAAGTSWEAHKKMRQDEKSEGEAAGGMCSEYKDLEQELRGSEALQIQLKEEKDRMHQTLQQQQIELEEKYQREKTELEEKFQSGALAQQAMLDEKEVLAQKLKEEVSKLQTELEEERKVLEERLQQEEERNRVLQEKENELRRLAEEKASLEERQEEERQRLQKQLQDTEIYKEELQLQVEAKNSAIQAKEEEYRRAEEEKQKLHDQLEQERLSREEEKYKIQEQLMQAKATEQLELKASIDALEAEKQNLMAELASSVTGFSEEKKKMVDNVSNVLEDEFQCAICNELFINAVLLNCGHTFCRFCIDRWKKNKNECPNCRVRITSQCRSVVVDNFIEKIVPTLSDEMKKKRAEVVAERNEEMKAQAQQAAASAQANQAHRGRGRGRARGRGNQGRPGVLVHTTNTGNTQPAAATGPSYFVNNPVPSVPFVVNHGINRLQMSAASLQNLLPAGQSVIRIRLPTNYAQTVRGGAVVRLHVPPVATSHTQPGPSGNAVGSSSSSGPAPSSSVEGRRGHWANGCPDYW